MSAVAAGYKQTEVGVIPEDWGCNSLQSLADSARPIGYGIVQTGAAVRNGVKCVRVVDIIDGRIDPETLITTSVEISQAYKRTLLRENDLVIALRGKIGAVAVIGKELSEDQIAFYCYLEYPINGLAKELGIKNNILTELYSDQKNMVFITKNKKRVASFLFDSEQYSDKVRL